MEAVSEITCKMKMEFKVTRTGEFGQKFTKCSICGIEFKMDGILKHFASMARRGDKYSIRYKELLDLNQAIPKKSSLTRKNRMRQSGINSFLGKGEKYVKPIELK